jgi:AraC-like DNA-binding protein
LSAVKAPLARLRALHERGTLLARKTPSIFADQEATRSLEQSCIGAMIDCLAVEPAEPDRAAVGQRQTIMRRFYSFIEENPDRALHLPEICVAIGATERTLRRCCQEQLGFGPKHYLLLRRMHLARRALRHADPANATVASIAARFGFWDFGRFAAAYKGLFSETPSVTLRHPGRAGSHETENAGEFLAEIT